jgi:hypothetical protein
MCLLVLIYIYCIYNTAVVMGITGRYMMVANAGDSRAVLMDGIHSPLPSTPLSLPSLSCPRSRCLSLSLCLLCIPGTSLSSVSLSLFSVSLCLLCIPSISLSVSCLAYMYIICTHTHTHIHTQTNITNKNHKLCDFCVALH